MKKQKKRNTLISKKEKEKKKEYIYTSQLHIGYSTSVQKKQKYKSDKEQS